MTWTVTSSTLLEPLKFETLRDYDEWWKGQYATFAPLQDHGEFGQPALKVFAQQADNLRGILSKATANETIDLDRRQTAAPPCDKSQLGRDVLRWLERDLATAAAFAYAGAIPGAGALNYNDRDTKAFILPSVPVGPSLRAPSCSPDNRANIGRTGDLGCKDFLGKTLTLPFVTL